MRSIGLKSFGAAVGIVALSVVAAAPASAHRGATVSDPIVDGLAGPLQFEVMRSGKILVGQAFSGTVSVVRRDGSIHDLFNDPGAEGVASGRHGSVIYTNSDFETGVIDLRLRTKSGHVKILGDLIAHEADRNPDRRQRYGLMGLSDECTAQLPPDVGILPYRGIVESHPYAIAATRGGWYVADAAGNDIVFVDWRGNVKTVAVLPAQPPVVVTAAAAAANDLPDCVIGKKFVAEPVPTDVEIGAHGKLYVSTLPGGPEDPSLGARGSVYRVDPRTGRSKRVATGFAGATNLAISPAGTIYVSELFGDQVSKIRHGRAVPVAAVSQPSGLEWSRGKLYVGVDTFGSGKIVTITP